MSVFDASINEILHETAAQSRDCLVEREAAGLEITDDEP